jgi:exosome complex component RRP42
MSSFRSTSCFSESERKYTIEGCETNLRLDGRGNADYRPYIVEKCSSNNTSLLVLSNGSSRVYLPNRCTDVVCSVKGEIVRPTLAQPSHGVLEVNVEFFASSSSQQQQKINKRNKRSDEMNLTQILSTLLGKAIHLDQLCIVPKNYVWKLFVDVFVVSGTGGNILDACSMAMYTALNVTYLPLVTPLSTQISRNQQQQHDTITKSSLIIDDLMVDGTTTETIPGATECPVTVTICRIGKKMVMDCTRLEEECCPMGAASLSVSVDKLRKVCGVHKFGEGSIPFKQLLQVNAMAVEASVKIFDLIHNAPSISSNSSEDVIGNNYTVASLFSSPFQIQ